MSRNFKLYYLHAYHFRILSIVGEDTKKVQEVFFPLLHRILLWQGESVLFSVVVVRRKIFNMFHDDHLIPSLQKKQKKVVKASYSPFLLWQSSMVKENWMEAAAATTTNNYNSTSLASTLASASTPQWQQQQYPSRHQCCCLPQCYGCCCLQNTKMPGGLALAISSPHSESTKLASIRLWFLQLSGMVDEDVNAFTYPQKLTFRTDHRKSLPELRRRPTT